MRQIHFFGTVRSATAFVTAVLFSLSAQANAELRSYDFRVHPITYCYNTHTEELRGFLEVVVDGDSIRISAVNTFPSHSLGRAEYKGKIDGNEFKVDGPLVEWKKSNSMSQSVADEANRRELRWSMRGVLSELDNSVAKIEVSRYCAHASGQGLYRIDTTWQEMLIFPRVAVSNEPKDEPLADHPFEFADDDQFSGVWAPYTTDSQFAEDRIVIVTFDPNRGRLHMDSADGSLSVLQATTKGKVLDTAEFRHFSSGAPCGAWGNVEGEAFSDLIVLVLPENSINSDCSPEGRQIEFRRYPVAQDIFFANPAGVRMAKDEGYGRARIGVNFETSASFLPRVFLRWGDEKVELLLKPSSTADEPHRYLSDEFEYREWVRHEATIANATRFEKSVAILAKPKNQDDMICGPDVTSMVYMQLDKILAAYKIRGMRDPNLNVPYCSALIDTTYGPNYSNNRVAELAWDIYPLYPTKSVASLAPRCARPLTSDPAGFQCDSTVVFERRCINSAIVNYVFWGFATELCDSSIGGIRHFTLKADIAEGLRNDVLKVLWNKVNPKGNDSWQVSAITDSQDLIIDLSRAYAALKLVEDSVRTAASGEVSIFQEMSTDPSAAHLAFEREIERYRTELDAMLRLEQSCKMTCEMTSEQQLNLSNSFRYVWRNNMKK